MKYRVKEFFEDMGYGKPYWSIINPCDNCPRENTNVEIITRWQDPTIEELKTQLQQKENIIKELEKHCETMLSIFEQMTDEQRQEQLDKYKIYDGFLRRLQELKGSDK